jgi:hypothetical protein
LCFPKGQVPPYAQPQITQFSVQEAIIKTCQSIVESYGLLSLPGTEGEVKVHEDVDTICKKYKIGDTIQFTASINAMYDPNMILQQQQQQQKEAISQIDAEETTNTIIDVVATSE